LSVEEQLLSIEEQYKRAYESIRYMATYPSSVKSVDESIKQTLAFLRSIELLYEDIRKLSDDKTEYYVKRCEDDLISIRITVRGGKVTYVGVCGELDRYNYSIAFDKFNSIRSNMYNILEDTRMIYALRIYPIEEKIALKSKLTDYGFEEVTKCLDEAEQNLASNHSKDCIDRSREALEKTVSSILITEKKTPSGHFSTDIGTITNMGILDKETKKLTEATYSYLSEVGAHGRGEKLTLGDAHYSMKETYMRIDVLLKKYAEHKKSEKK
jgi:HEPN domain-containing protein